MLFGGAVTRAVADQVFGTLEMAALVEWIVEGVEYGKRLDWQIVD